MIHPVQVAIFDIPFEKLFSEESFPDVGAIKLLSFNKGALVGVCLWDFSLHFYDLI